MSEKLKLQVKTSEKSKLQVEMSDFRIEMSEKLKFRVEKARKVEVSDGDVIRNQHISPSALGSPLGVSALGRSCTERRAFQKTCNESFCFPCFHVLSEQRYQRQQQQPVRSTSSYLNTTSMPVPASDLRGKKKKNIGPPLAEISPCEWAGLESQRGHSARFAGHDL